MIHAIEAIPPVIAEAILTVVGTSASRIPMCPQVAGSPLVKLMVRSFRIFFAGVWPSPQTMNDQISHPIPRVIVMRAMSRAIAPKRC